MVGGCLRELLSDITKSFENEVVLQVDTHRSVVFTNINTRTPLPSAFKYKCVDGFLTCFTEVSNGSVQFGVVLFAFNVDVEHRAVVREGVEFGFDRRQVHAGVGEVTQ